MTKVFISYKTGEPNDQEAELLYNELTKQGINVFLDKREFHAGISWDASIYRNISESDVLIVLITSDAASPWVQREVDYALGCRVAVLPAVINAKEVPEADGVMKKLAIQNLQYAVAFGSHKPEIRYGEILQSIPKLAAETRMLQAAWLKELQEKWRKADKADPLKQPPDKTILKYASFAFFPNGRQPHPCTLHLTAGNITEAQPVDVLVNSENVYMQMQRVFAPKSVSKQIRLDGARVRGRHYIEEDTIQQELNDQLFGAKGGGVPVSQGTVLVTSSGYDRSKLRQRGVDYVFHVAVVEATTDREFPVENPEVVKECVRNCFQKILELDDPDQPIRSIIFPVLASGNAGLDLLVSARGILEAFKEFLIANPQAGLKDIYLAVYARGDIQKIDELFGQDRQLKRLTEP